jgi:HEPN domain-containing protein
MDNLHILHWFEFAEDDLNTAKILTKHGDRQINAVCYHSQQSAEKNLKGYLVAKGVSTPPKIHDLHDLCDKCSSFDESFNEILRVCDNLNPYGVRVKYPDEIEVSEIEARQAIADAEAIQAFAPIVAVRASLEADYKENMLITEVSAIAGDKSTAEKPEKLIDYGDTAPLIYAQL